jgi:excisionase family DNA binding protein
MALLPTGDDGELVEGLSANVDEENALTLGYHGAFGPKFGHVFDLMMGITRPQASESSASTGARNINVPEFLQSVSPGGDERLLTPSEVAGMFRVNPKTVTRWARAGKISAIRTLGGHRRFRASEIRRFLESDTE